MEGGDERRRREGEDEREGRREDGWRRREGRKKTEGRRQEEGGGLHTRYLWSIPCFIKDVTDPLGTIIRFNPFECARFFRSRPRAVALARGPEELAVPDVRDSEEVEVGVSGGEPPRGVRGVRVGLAGGDLDFGDEDFEGVLSSAGG